MPIINRRTFFSKTVAGMAALGTIGPLTSSAQFQRIEMEPNWNIAEFEKIVRLQGRVKQLYDLHSLEYGALVHIKNSLNGFQWGFGISQDQIRIVAVSRGQAIPMNFDDSVWKKYKFGELFHIKDPKTGKPAERNVFYPSHAGPDLKYSSDSVESLSSIYGDRSIQALQHRGVRLLCCHNATANCASGLAAESRGKQTAQEVYQDLVSHTLPGVLIVPTAVSAVGMLQYDGGYSYIYA